MAAILQKTASSLVATKASKAPRVSRASVVVKASSQEVSRRELISGVVSAATLLAAAPAFAEFGDSANVFGRKTNATGFIPYAGEGFSISLPSRWNPSPEQEFPGTILRYSDNGDSINSLCVIAQPTTKTSIEDLGTPDKFLEQVSYLLGQQSYAGQTRSEGGFAPDRVSAASVLDIASTTDKKGRTVYNYEILTRTADGDEGGKHQLIKALVANGNLWIFKAQVGDKRWFKGVNKDALGALNSFTVA